jgi:hypothetical protein
MEPQKVAAQNGSVRNSRDIDANFRQNFAAN